MDREHIADCPVVKGRDTYKAGDMRRVHAHLSGDKYSVITTQDGNILLNGYLRMARL